MQFCSKLHSHSYGQHLEKQVSKSKNISSQKNFKNNTGNSNNYNQVNNMNYTKTITNANYKGNNYIDQTITSQNNSNIYNFLYFHLWNNVFLQILIFYKVSEIINKKTYCIIFMNIISFLFINVICFFISWTFLSYQISGIIRRCFIIYFDYLF